MDNISFVPDRCARYSNIQPNPLNLFLYILNHMQITSRLGSNSHTKHQTDGGQAHSFFAQMVNKSVHTTSSLPETRIMDSRLRNYDPDLLYLPISKTKHFMSSFFYDTTMLWNSLPPEVRNSQNIKAFIN